MISDNGSMNQGRQYGLERNYIGWGGVLLLFYASKTDLVHMCTWGLEIITNPAQLYRRSFLLLCSIVCSSWHVESNFVMVEPSTGSQNDNSGQAKRAEILQHLGTVEPAHLTSGGTTATQHWLSFFLSGCSMIPSKYFCGRSMLNMTNSTAFKSPQLRITY